MQVQERIDELLALRASEWLELLPTASSGQLRAFEAWLLESRLHVQEFLEIAEIEFSLGHLDAGRRHDVDRLLERIGSQVTALPARPVAGPFSSTPSPQRQPVWRRTAIAAVAAIIAVTVGALIVQHGATRQYSTSLGEQRTVELADASVVTLNVSSRIDVRLQPTGRDIDLRQGEAIFKVARDVDRPFRVHTRAAVVQAIGTQFNVRDRPDGTTRVSVIEGRVRATSSRETQILLNAGEEADIFPDGAIHPRQHGVVTNSIAWRQHRLMFDSASLEEMAAEFNRYNQSVRLRVEGLQGDPRRYDGAFEATEPNSIAALLSREPDLIVERRGNEIVIRKR